MTTRLIVGLGNPGERHRDTRHNVGFAVLDLLAQRLGATEWRRSQPHKTEADYAEVPPGLVLLKPMRGMNLSGTPVARVARRLSRRTGVVPDIVVVHDDMDVPFGDVRFQLGGPSAGHQGLRSIIESRIGADFARVRVGIGRGVDVVGCFEPHERACLDQVLAAAVAAVLEFMQQGGAYAVQV